MARDSRIEWTDHTFNPWWGCTKVSPACDNCYADTWAKRVGLDIWGAGKPRRFLSDAYWRQPRRWNAEAQQSGHRARVFCASMADVFEWKRGLSYWRHRLWHLIEETPYLDWLLLTKRPHLAQRLAPWDDHWPDNVWLGTTVENQRWVNKRLPRLTEIPARTRFLSCEPLLGPIDLRGWLGRDVVHWVIAGGESGPRARPSDPLWFFAIRDQCAAHETPFHFKQWGEWAPLDTLPGILPRSVLDDGSYSTPMGKYGKKASGRILGSRTWDDFPCSEEEHFDASANRESATAAGPLHGDSPLAFQPL
ncbi:MAG: phage Gp37/Gp68 family protein [Gammaproteobacteria bacterium]|nr:phage Gp37/Gp68 family protein [Gammaproteobacteria bacterium]